MVRHCLVGVYGIYKSSGTTGTLMLANNIDFHQAYALDYPTLVVSELLLFLLDALIKALNT